MRWENVEILLLLWIVPVLAAVLIYAQRKRNAAAARFVEQPMAKQLLPEKAIARTWTKSVLLLVGVSFLIVGAARPRFGVFFEEVTSRGADIVVLLDVSKSMMATDVAPNRLERAKSDIRDLLRRLSGDRLGLIAFAGAPSVLVPLTNDQGFFLAALDDIDTDSAPRGGSLIGDAIRKALEITDDNRQRDQVMILITDGEDHESYPIDAAKQAADRGVKVFTIGLGDTIEGSRIPVRDQSGQLRFVKKEDGQEHWSQMNERLLKEIALATDGAYIPAKTTSYDLGQIYEDHLADIARSELSTEKRKRYRDRFQLFILCGVTCLLVEMAIPRFRSQNTSGEKS